MDFSSLIPESSPQLIDSSSKPIKGNCTKKEKPESIDNQESLGVSSIGNDLLWNFSDMVKLFRDNVRLQAVVKGLSGLYVFLCK